MSEIEVETREIEPRGAGFYRLDNGELLYALSEIATPTGTYCVAEHESYMYPIDGAWRYFTDEAAAVTFFGGG